MWRTVMLSVTIQATSVTGLCAQGAPAGAVESENPTASSERTSSEPGASSELGREVRAIFQEHCIACHGPDEQQKGLRLDDLSGARHIAGTGRPILGGALEMSELFHRVNSADPAYRMPSQGDRLSDAKIETIRQWVLADCPWPDDAQSKSLRRPDADDSWQLRFALPALDRALAVEVWLKRNRYFKQFLWGGLALLVLTLVVERYRKRARRGQPTTPWAKHLSSVTVGAMASFWAMVAIVFALFQARGHRDDLLKQVASLRQSSNPIGYSRDAAGDSKAPLRLTHPKALDRTYFRGNCERNVQLFNGGNYCTATFRVSLRTASGSPLEYRQTVPDDELVMHFELKRAPGTSAEFFTPDTMAGLFLSEEVADAKAVSPGSNRVALRVSKADWVWECDVPVTKSVSPEGCRCGLVYLFPGRQYAIKYEIQIEDDCIGSGSDIWMACLDLGGNVQVPPSRGQIPFCEWFDWRPLPEIDGPNSTDPKILGILDYRPDFQRPADDPAKNTESSKTADPE